MRTLILILACTLLPGAEPVRYVGKTKYLNNARAVVTHNIDDSTKYVPNAIDAMDKYGIKATIFISTDEDPAPEERFLTQLMVKELWPRLKQAVDNGHEIGSHSQTHPCRRQETEAACSEAYTPAEVTGSRDVILKRTQQPYVWTWCYPCGTCANLETIQKRIAAAGYIVARNYPMSPMTGTSSPICRHGMRTLLMPLIRKWFRSEAARPRVRSSMSPSSMPSSTKSTRTRASTISCRIRNWLDFGPENFYEKHLAHVSRKPDVWYVPMGPLYAYKTIYDHTEVRAPQKRTLLGIQ